MKIEVLSVTKNPEQLIEAAARSCYNSTPNPESRPNFIKGLIKSGHESPVEHAVLSVKITDCSRAFTHQVIRHRLLSVSQQSQRYCKFNPADLRDGFVYPESIESNEEAKKIYESVLENIVNGYDKLAELGIKREDARFLLPNAAKTEITLTGNFREWRHFFEVRCDIHAQWEIRIFALSLLYWLVTKTDAHNVFVDLVNKFFDDLPADYPLVDIEYNG